MEDRAAPPNTSSLPGAARWLAPGIFEGRCAFVTGGGTGLGLAISRGLAYLGARVAIGSRTREHHAALLDEARARRWQVNAFQVDVRDDDAVERVAKEVEEALGPVDILVNNAAGNFLCPAERLSPRGWRAVVGIVLDGTFFCSRVFGRRMIAQRRGSILNVVATYAWTGMPGVVHSASAKAGVLAMTRTLAAEWAQHDLRVNAIAPGPFFSAGAAQNLFPEPEMEARLRRAVPLRRLGTAEEIAAHCLYLLSPACDYVTGECFVVDGGLALARNVWAGPELLRKPHAHRDNAEEA